MTARKSELCSAALFLWLLASVVPPVFCLDNGLALTPPMGWTSWTSAWLDVNQTYMEQSMDALSMQRLDLGSLSSFGYKRAGLDDAWQACGTGWNGSFHDKAGHPLVNVTRFPSMNAMTAHAHSRGLEIGWYLNNCYCAEHGWTSPKMVSAHYAGDIAALASFGFDGAKFDACGEFENLSHWEELINATGHATMIENCHWGGDAPYVLDHATEELWCPYNIYRSGMDIAPNNWVSFMANLNSLVDFLHHEPPLSRPGCWAYPDSVQTGSYERLEEDRTNFGAWCITSSPLVLGMDVTNDAALERVWAIITNAEAIAVNQNWSGHPGRLVRQSTRQLSIQYAHARPCDAQDTQQRDWVLGPASRKDSTRSIRSKSTGLCADAWSHALTLEPCSSNASQQFFFDEQDGTLKAPNYPNNEGKMNGCLDISGKTGPRIQLTECLGQPNQAFAFSATGIWADLGDAQPYPKRCIQVEHGFSIEAQLWAKPQPKGAVAAFAFNAGDTDSMTFDIDLEKDLQLPAGRSYAVRDIWALKDLSPIHEKLSTGSMNSHDSRFFLLTPLHDDAYDTEYV